MAFMIFFCLLKKKEKTFLQVKLLVCLKSHMGKILIIKKETPQKEYFFNRKYFHLFILSGFICIFF